MTIRKIVRLALLPLFVLLVAACDNAEERSQAHYERGLELVEAGEPEKAILEFRNALKLNQEALEPRFEFAKLLMTHQQNYQGAVGNFLKVVELDPQHFEARKALGQLYMIGQAPEEAGKHIDVAFELKPDDAEVKSLKASHALRSGDPELALKLAQEVLSAEPGQETASIVMAGHWTEQGDYQKALLYLNDALTVNPTSPSLLVVKLQAIEKLEDMALLGPHLEDMMKAFPDNVEVAQSLAQWHIARSDEDKAEAVLRELAAANPEDLNSSMVLVSFLEQVRGSDAAREELLARSQSGPNANSFKLSLARKDYQTGEVEGAISLLRDNLASGLEGSDAFETKNLLAAILFQSGDKDEALSLAEEVLGEDPENVDSLKLRAENAIQTDDPEAAISDLRTALNSSPQDPAILTLLAAAHERNGSKGLAQERLALALEASQSGVLESLRYSEFLLRDGKPDVAFEVLSDTIRTRGEDPRLLVALARIHIANKDWGKAEELANKLRSAGSIEQASNIADRIRVASLAGQNDLDGVVEKLEGMWSQSGESSGAMSGLVQSYVRQGDIEKAETFLENILKNDPENLRALLLRGLMYRAGDDNESAESTFRKAIESNPQVANGYSALVSLLNAQGRTDEADEILQAGLENAENKAQLQFRLAAQLEVDGEFETAIELYEDLYSQDSNNLVLANNLASLLSDYRTDEESLERAFNVAKRLRTSDVPAFQDTYGWIIYRRGDLELAVVPLKKAAEGLPDNPIVQYHLGEVYLGLGQADLAKAQFEKAVQLGEGTAYPQVDVARQRLESMQ